MIDISALDDYTNFPLSHISQKIELLTFYDLLGSEAIFLMPFLIKELDLLVIEKCKKKLQFKHFWAGAPLLSLFLQKRLRVKKQELRIPSSTS